MLLYFILGILFLALGMPIIQNTVSVLTAISQYIVYYFAYKVVKIKRSIGQQDQEQEQQIPPAIGFQIPIEQEVYYQEVDE